jgi:hypothetical protein
MVAIHRSYTQLLQHQIMPTFLSYAAFLDGKEKRIRCGKQSSDVYRPWYASALLGNQHGKRKCAGKLI